MKLEASLLSSANIELWLESNAVRGFSRQSEIPFGNFLCTPSPLGIILFAGPLLVISTVFVKVVEVVTEFSETA